MNDTIKSNEIFQKALTDLNLIRQNNPVVHNLTNLVVMQTTANMLLAIGASPIMAHAHEELADILSIANSLVINMGTLDSAWVTACDIAQQTAHEKKVPIIFDPVGAGASQFRTHTAKKILQRGVSILRGNASEIMTLVDDYIKTKGVDSRHKTEDAISAAKSLSKKYQCTVVISGETDIIIKEDNEAFIHFGTPMFTKVTGMGCSATAIIGAFAAINPDPFLAATNAVAIFTIAGEMAAANANGPASFYNNLIDTLYSL